MTFFGHSKLRPKIIKFTKKTWKNCCCIFMYVWVLFRVTTSMYTIFQFCEWIKRKLVRPLRFPIRSRPVDWETPEKWDRKRGKLGNLLPWIVTLALLSTCSKRLLMTSSNVFTGACDVPDSGSLVLGALVPSAPLLRLPDTRNMSITSLGMP